MKFAELSGYLEKLEKTSSRLEITEILADLFKKAKTDEIDIIVYLILGSLAPGYKNIVFNLAEKLVLHIISSAYSVNLERVKGSYKSRGDLGQVAGELSRKYETSPSQRALRAGGQIPKSKQCFVMDVYKELLRIAKDEGEGSVERKVKNTARLLSRLDYLSVRYVTRIIMGKLRLGFSDKTILDAISWMVKKDKSEKHKLEKAYNVFPDVGWLAKEVKKKGIEKATKNIKPVIGVPVLPMLAQRLKSPSEMIEKMEEVSVEPKFDGLRIQLHFNEAGFEGNKKGKVKAYTRNLNENSWMFPELESLGNYLNVKSTILDCEAIGVDEERRTLANFQTTMTRRRKHKIEEISKKVKIKFYVFDIMARDGKSLIALTYIKRRKELENAIKSGDLLEVVDYEITRDAKKIEEFMQEELKEGMEGIIVKRADSKYVAGRTGWRWVKMKEEEGAKAKLADTVDCVVMGYIKGRGKRTQFGIGGFLAGIVGGEKIKTLTKVGTGLTDEQFRELKERLRNLEVKVKPREYGKVAKNLVPDVWVEPSLVVEIAADEITKSPTHSSGFALRFPRLVKFRDDKSVDQSTKVNEIKKLYNIK